MNFPGYLGVVVHTCNSSTQKADTGESGAQSQNRQFSKTLSENKNKKGPGM
jgi:hypothetical protein